jgi:PadR family transcriptional regulator, regulatory protein PadR
MSIPPDPRPLVPKNFLRPCVLLLLREQPAHGYELLERLQPLGFERDDPGRLYRALRALEDEGLVHSVWEASQTGPARRTYEITRAGMEHLHEAAHALLGGLELVDVFLSRYGEFVALDHAPRRSRAAR